MYYPWPHVHCKRWRDSTPDNLKADWIDHFTPISQAMGEMLLVQAIRVCVGQCFFCLSFLAYYLKKDNGILFWLPTKQPKDQLADFSRVLPTSSKNILNAHRFAWIMAGVYSYFRDFQCLVESGFVAPSTDGVSRGGWLLRWQTTNAGESYLFQKSFTMIWG